MGAMSRRKGATGEREVASLFRAAGFPCDRTPNSGGLFIPGDVTGVDGLHVEVKRAERISILEWCRQAERDALLAPEALPTPLVVFRSSREPWRACLPLSDFLTLLGEARR